MAIDLGSVALKVTPDLANFRPELDKGISQSMKRIGGTMQKTGAIATGVITAPILAGFSKATTAASSLNESVNAVNVVFGDAADKVHDFAQVAADEAGLSMRAFNAAAVPIGAVLQNVGFGADEAADASIGLAKRAADLASVYDTDLDTALAAIQSGLRGQMEPLTAFGAGMTAAEVDAHALELGLADTAGELDENAKMQARLSLLMQRTDKVSGDFKNTIGDVANAERNVGAEAENAAAKFGEKLLPAKLKLTQIGGSLVDRFNNMSPAMQNSAVAAGAVAAAAGPAVFALGTMVKAAGNIIEHGPKVVGALGKVGSGALSMGKSALTGAGNVAKATATMAADAAKATGRVVKQVAVQVGRWVFLGAQSLIHAAKVAAAWLMSIWPIAAVIAAVVGLVVVIVKNWETIKRVIAAGWEWVKNTTRRLWDAITGFLSRTVDNIKRAISSGLEAIKRTWNTAWTAVKDFVVARFNDVVGLVKGLPGRAKTALSSAWNAYKAYWSTVFTAAKNFVVDRFTDVVNLVKGLPQRAKDALLATWNILKSYWEAIFNAIRNLVGDRITNIVGFVGDLPGRAKTALVNTWQTFYGHWKRVFNTVKDAVKDRIDAMVRFFRELPGRILSALGNVGSKIASKFTFGLTGTGDGPGASRGGTALATVRNAMQGISGLYVTNTYRTPAHNRRVGGSPTSFHLDKTNPAVDVGGSMAALDKLHSRLARVGGRELLWRTKGHYDHLHYAHEGGVVGPRGIEPLRRDELDTRLQVGEMVLPKDFTGGPNALLAEVQGLRQDVNDVRAEVRRQTDRNQLMVRTR